MNLDDLRGHTPPTCGQRGTSLGPLVRRGSVSSNNMLEKEGKRCALSAMAAGALLARHNRIWRSLGHVGRLPRSCLSVVDPILRRVVSIEKKTA